MTTSLIACLQTRPQPTFDTAIEEARTLANRALDQGADLLILPEYAGGLATNGAKLAPPIAPEGQHPFVDAMQEIASDAGAWLMIGSVAVQGTTDRFLNRGYLIDSAGKVAGHYDKVHMFDIQLSETEVYLESASVAPGNRSVIHDTPFGRIGHTICYDLRFPHLYRMLAQAGAEILTAPAAFTAKTGAAHWHILNRARAIETMSFMISPCSVGPIPGGGAAYGHSLIVAPWGEILAEGSADGSDVVVAEIDLDWVAEARRKIPSLSHDRAISKPEGDLAKTG